VTLVVNTIKTALEHEIMLFQVEDEDAMRAGLTHKVEKLCRALRVSEQGKAQLLEHVETLLRERTHQVKTPQ
jgi:hypothetical protein